ncbi:YdhR family protein [Vibrio sp.]|uniref:YdhR family protein n=1 Tax=Vibrio sp. TaxID=678 RepID=UPI003D153573
MAVILFVRIETGLELPEPERRLQERKPSFNQVPGLIQKIYGHDPVSGGACGIYFFADQPSLEAFRDSELARTIPSAYEATDVRREVYQFLYPLYEDKGPLS